MVKFVRCGDCGVELDEEKCVFANEKRVIDGKEYVFCCKSCADTYEKEHQE
jgi:YHS domain-containing protein